MLAHLAELGLIGQVVRVLERIFAVLFRITMQLTMNRSINLRMQKERKKIEYEKPRTHVWKILRNSP